MTPLSELPYSITFPSEASSLAYVRLFVASVARRHGFGDDTNIADLKLLASEAVALALTTANEDTRLSLGIAEGTTEIRVSPVLRFGESDQVPDPFDVVSALASEARLIEGVLVLLYSPPQVT